MTSTGLRLEDFLPYRLSFTSNLVSEQIAQVYASLFALTIPEWRLVAVITEAGETTQRDICDRTRMDKVTVSRAALALVGRNLVERLPNPVDNRSHLLRLTATGQDLYASIAPKALAMEQAIFARLNEAEQQLLKSLLLRIDGSLLTG